jgi:hypothetical protein
MGMPETEEFAKLLVQQVRDAAIRSSDNTFREDHVIARRWKEAAASGLPETLASTMIPDIVDSTIAHLLRAIDQEQLRLSFTASNGVTIDLTTVAKNFGELGGWYRGGGGWCEKYSSERWIDDFANLEHFFDKPHPPDPA